MKNGPYELVKAPSGYPGKKYRGKYVYEHHLVWWENTGALLPSGRVIHHKNHDKRDNRFDNLALEDWSEHSRAHGLEQGKATIELRCAWCGVSFIRKLRQYRQQLKRQRNFFCCKSHQVKFQWAFQRKLSTSSSSG